MSDLSIAHVTIDCTGSAQELAGFYAELLGSRINDGGSEFFATVATTPVLMFIRVPDRTPGKNAIHLDLLGTDKDAEIERAIGLGAKRLNDYDEYGAVWSTLADPEGNLFDIGLKR
jgi:hypothetical protein